MYTQFAGLLQQSRKQCLTIVTIQSDNSEDKSIASEMCLVDYPMLQGGSIPFFFFDFREISGLGYIPSWSSFSLVTDKLGCWSDLDFEGSIEIMYGC